MTTAALTTASPPRILLVEDDPASRAFLAAAAEALPARVDCAGTIAQARALAAAHTYDLLLADANLPDGRGADLLRELRRQHPVAALAHTAATTRAAFDALIDAGFAEVLAKPMSAMQLQHAIHRVLQQPRRASTRQSMQRCGKPPAWDEAAALAAVNGQAPQAMQLRTLFLAELPLQRDAVLAAIAQGDAAALHVQLHRLQGSCGFVGAARLGAAVRGLQDAPDPAAVVHAFAGAVEDTLASGRDLSA